MRGVGYNSSIARACTRHRVTRITRLRRRGSRHSKPQSAMGPRWDGNGTISTTSSSTPEPREKSTNSNGRRTRGSPRASLRRRIKERRAVQKKAGARPERKRSTDSHLTLGNSQLPVSVLLVASRVARLPLTTWNQDRLPDPSSFFAIIIYITLYTLRYANVRLKLNAIISRFLLLLYG